MKRGWGISPCVWYVCHFKDTVVDLKTSVIVPEAASRCSHWWPYSALCCSWGPALPTALRNWLPLVSTGGAEGCLLVPGWIPNWTVCARGSWSVSSLASAWHEVIITIMLINTQKTLSSMLGKAEAKPKTWMWVKLESDVALCTKQLLPGNWCSR